jgi:alpha-beta hydrolase superfamily lysophospholipase
MTISCSRKRSVTLRLVLAAALVAVGVLSSAGVAEASTGPPCRRQALPVTLSAASTTRYTIVGWLCTPARQPGTAVQVLLSGLTYDHHYWDLPYRPDRYSYVRAAVSRGETVFNLDRIGVGDSDRPPASQVDVAAEAYVTHQVVQALRRGEIGGTRFRQVFGVGHSMGSAIWIYEAAVWGDVDGLVLTSYLHRPNVTQQQAIAATLYPASDDPAFTGRTMPAEYVTTAPGTRLADFYLARTADPAVVGLDEALKQTATSGERATLNLAREPVYSQAIRAPVLLIVGQYDSLGCNQTQGLSCLDTAAVRGREAPYFSHAADLRTVVVPDAGHSIALHPNASRWFHEALTWTAHLTQRHSGGCRLR